MIGNGPGRSDAGLRGKVALVHPRTLYGVTPRAWRVLRTLHRHRILRAIRGRDHWPEPEGVRAALEELGVVYLKFGQVLALRRDLLPRAYINALETLHDDLPPLSFQTVREVVEAALGGTLASRFASFDPEPIAAATIAQVHGATLEDGRNVVVKVRRPGLEERIGEDIVLLTYLATLAERFHPPLRSLDLVGMVHEFRSSLLRETDFLREADTTRRFRAALADQDDVWVPDVVTELTVASVLTMERSDGERIDRYVERHPGERRSLAERVAALMLHQVFVTGLFQADPHPGNVFVTPGGPICLHDFGMVGELDGRTRAGLAELLEAVVSGDARGLTDTYLELGWVGPEVDRAALERDLEELLRNVHERPLEAVSVGRAIESLLQVGAEHRVRNPGVLLLLARAFLITEALMHQLDPTLSVVEAFRGELVRIRRDKPASERVLQRAAAALRDVERLARDAPREADRLLRRLGAGELGRVHLPALEAASQRATRDIERLTGAVASAALVIAGALLVGIEGWHRLLGDLFLVAGVAGTLATAAGALWQKRW